MTTSTTPPADDDRIAIIGMAGRFPGAPDIDALWTLSAGGRSGLSTLHGQPPGLVPVRGVVDDTDRFDAGYFGIPEREARMLDPQQRVLLEVAQHAFDDAAVDYTAAENVAVYAACAPQPVQQLDGALSERYERQLANEAGFAAMRLAYRLGLRGESISVETACSSSLTAVHLACQSLLSGQADLALAGGVSIPPNQDEGYAVETGMIASPTGRCRPFDSEADGTVPGAGVGLVVLKRLADADRDRDRIRAVILATAANNDGATKIGFMAPSPEGQAEVIATAHAVAGVAAGSIGYVETHGTATKLGDAAEIEGLRRSFELDHDRDQVCALGSLKANCGHLDRAAGVAGLIRATLALQHRTIPPMAGFTEPNPDLDLDSGKFRIPTRAEPWPARGGPRRAGVSAFGVGGTNVHVVLEEAPNRTEQATQPPGAPVLLALSGHTPAAVRRQATDLAGHLDRGRDDLTAVAQSLVTGRRQREYRASVVATSPAQAATELRDPPPAVRGDERPTIAFAFPGQGVPYVDGLAALYEAEPVYRQAIDKHAEILTDHLGYDIRSDLYGDHDPAARVELFRDVRRFQPAALAVELALAELWRAWGLVPDVVLGHSKGEVGAAACAGVFTREDALAFIVRRSSVMYDAKPGANISVALPAARVAELLPDGAVIAAINGAELTAVTGPPEQIEPFAERLSSTGVHVRRLHIHTTPHSPAMHSAAERLRDFAATLRLSPPSLRLLSNVTGGWADDFVSTPDYWRDQLRSPVRFAEQLERITGLPAPLIIVIGADEGFGRMIDHEIGPSVAAVVPSVRASGSSHADLLRAAGIAWSHGADLDFPRLLPATRDRAILPPTPFDHSRRWPRQHQSAPARRETTAPVRRTDPDSWLYEPRWIQPTVGVRRRPERVGWIGAGHIARSALAAELNRTGGHLVPYADLSTMDEIRDVLWWVGDEGPDLMSKAWRIGEHLSGERPGSRVWMLAPPVGPDSATLSPRSLALAVARVLPQELPGLSWHLVEVGDPLAADELLDLVGSAQPAPVLRGDADGYREFAVDRAWPDWRPRQLREHGCYVITGGAGIVGRALATALCREVPATIVLTGRSPVGAMHGDLGPSVSYRAVDITDSVAVTELFDDLRARFGRIDGVIHAAALTDRNQFVIGRDAGADVVGAISAAKVLGCANIASALSDADADFVLLCSSLSVILGGLRFGPYVAANTELEEFARRRHELGDRRWLAVGWDVWSETVRPDQAGPGRYALTPEDGHEVFRRLLSARGPVVYTSTGDLHQRVSEVAAQLTTGFAGTPAAPADAGAVPPEAAVRTAIRETLGAVPADRDRDLRKDGIESLAVLQIVRRLEATTGVRIPLGQAFGALTVAGLEELARRAATGPEPVTTQVEVRPGTAGERESHPTTAVQRRWLDLLDHGYGGIDLPLEVTGVDPNSLAEAITRVIDRHSALRTTFHHTDDGWTQRIQRPPDVKVVDLSELDGQHQRNELAAINEAISERWFDVSINPPFEVTVVALGPDRSALLLHAHHVVLDGWSSSLFLRDVALATGGALTGTAPQYVDYAAAQAGYPASDRARRALSYWQNHFHGAPAPTRIAASHQVADQTDRGERLELRFRPDLPRLLKERAVTENTTVFALMMSAFGMLVHHLSGARTDLVIGTTSAGRTSIETEETVGVFVSPLPLRLRVEPSESVRDLVRGVHDTLIGFHEHGHLPMEDLVRSVEPFVDAGLNDTFHCYLLYQNYWRPHTGDINVRRLHIPGAGHHKLMREFEIILEADDSGRLSGELWYLPSRFSTAIVHRWGELYAELLHAISAGSSVVSVSALLSRYVNNAHIEQE